MPLKQQDEQQDGNQQTQERQHLAAIGTQVMQTLGRPGNLQRLQVRQVWEGHYRVNVFIGADAAMATIAHSFFLVTDDDGKITASTPKIGKRY